MSTIKVYSSAAGLKFAISNIAKPAEGDVVFFTQKEFTWLTQQKPTAEQFKLIWQLKHEDHRYDPIPKVQDELATQRAERYCKEIMGQLKLKQVPKQQEKKKELYNPWSPEEFEAIVQAIDKIEKKEKVG